MLSRNDQLSLGGRAPRARRSCYVDEPACGFFIAGSSLKPSNGVYTRRNPPQAALALYAAQGRQPLLYYQHMDRGSEWTMALVETVGAGAADEEESDYDDDDPYGSAYRRPKPEPERWWCISQEGRGTITDRFRHIGDTIVPGAGAPRWSHMHGSAQPAGQAEQADRSWFGFGSSSQPTALARAAEDDEDELPWQVSVTRPLPYISPDPTPSSNLEGALSAISRGSQLRLRVFSCLGRVKLVPS